MIELNSPLPVSTPRGDGYAYFIIDYGMEHDLQWVVFLTTDGSCWTFRNPEIRLSYNATLGRLPKPRQETIINQLPIRGMNLAETK